MAHDHRRQFDARTDQHRESDVAAVTADGFKPNPDGLWYGDRWRLDGVAPNRKLTRYAGPTAVEWVWEHDNSDRFNRLITTLRAEHGEAKRLDVPEPQKASESLSSDWHPVPASPKTAMSVTTEYFVTNTYGGTGVKMTHGPIDSERDARLIVELLTYLSDAQDKSYDPDWYAYERKVVVEETRL